jgi:hypothetical protein
MTAITAPAIPARGAHPDREPRLSRLEALLDALGYAGALIDRSGVLAVQRYSQANDDH